MIAFKYACGLASVTVVSETPSASQSAGESL